MIRCGLCGDYHWDSEPCDARNVQWLILRPSLAHELWMQLSDYNTYMTSSRLQKDIPSDHYFEISCLAVRLQTDGWKTFVWVLGTLSPPIIFMPTHLVMHPSEDEILAMFDDFTVLRPRNQPQQHPFFYLRNVALSYDLHDSGEREQCEYELGRLYLQSNYCATPWHYEYSYFAVHIKFIRPTLLSLGPGSSGLQLFWGTRLVGILTGCCKSRRNLLIFLNAGMVASAARLRSDYQFRLDPQMTGSLRRSLDLNYVELWRSHEAVQFGRLFSHDANSPTFKVAFLIYMCYFHYCDKTPNLVRLEPADYKTNMGADATKTVRSWVKKLRNCSLDRLPTANLIFPVDLATQTGAERCSKNDIKLLCTAVIKKPHAQSNYYPASIFFAQFIDRGRKTTSGCWLPNHLVSAYEAARCLNNDANYFLPMSPTLTVSLNKTWFAYSEIPYSDADSAMHYNSQLHLARTDMKVTACHHPFLCELSETKAEKGRHKHSHICVRLSHLEMAPKRVNSHHLKIQNAARKRAINNVSTVAARIGAAQALCDTVGVVANLNVVLPL